MTGICFGAIIYESCQTQAHNLMGIFLKGSSEWLNPKP
jgi:hypothetical protein